MHQLGQTRSSHKHDHLLQTPDTFVRTPLPQLEGGAAVVHIGPAGGANFAQYTAELEPGGTLSGGALERFVFVLAGEGTLKSAVAPYALRPGSFCFLPQGEAHALDATSAMRVVVIERRYRALADTPAPQAVLGHAEDVLASPLNGDEGVRVQALVPASASFDLAVNLMTYAPGAALAQVEVHVMEHGLLMLDGGGIYRLGDSWYPVAAGDFIWMAPFCPQWFGALGRQPARYLIYKDWNRTPLGVEL